MEFKREETEGMKPTTLKAVSIQALPSNKFVILDSTGDLHILCLSAPAVGPNVMAHMRWLPHSMKVQKLAVLPDISSSNSNSSFCFFFTFFIFPLNFDDDCMSNNGSVIKVFIGSSEKVIQG